ncbi:MAG: hypothetical protein BMS9Abin36_1431 [Gammaproteobacteria bacterium]|nr:MAG: hypothetical protein BMS9Abin36_1431 [Gammaproteobacteria bacterium]
MRCISRIYLIGLLLIVFLGSAGAEDRINLEGTSIIGNSELPKVLYIVPWKKAPIGDLVGRPVESLLDEVLSPLDRDIFRREISYYQLLNAKQ